MGTETFNTELTFGNYSVGISFDSSTLASARRTIKVNWSGSGPSAGMPIGMNLSFYAYYIFSHPMVDITKGMNFQVVGGTLNGQTLPESYRDANGYPSSAPIDSTSLSLVFQYPEVAEQYKLTWSIGGTGTGTPASMVGSNMSGVSAISGNSMTLTPNAFVAGLDAAPFFHYTMPADGTSWPTGFVCRPVSDPGTVWSNSFLTKLSQSIHTAAPLRPMHWQGVEYELGINNTATIAFPQNGDGQLAYNLLTSTYRNGPNSGDWTGAGVAYCHLDGVPIEKLINLGTALGRAMHYAIPYNCDDTNADGTPNNSSTYLTLAASQWAAWSKATGQKLYIARTNEPWNFGYKVANQIMNEAFIRGKTAADALPNCVVATTANITLSGTQTIDGVAVTAGQRVLVVAQTVASQNGPYVCAAGAWSRAADVVATKSLWYISSGTTNGNRTFICTNTGTITLGTTNLTIPQFTRAMRYAEKAVNGFAYFETAFNAQGIGPANGSSNLLVRGLEWQNEDGSYGNPSSVTVDWDAMLSVPGVSGHVDALSTAAYWDQTEVGGSTSYSGTDANFYTTYARPAIDRTLWFLNLHVAYANAHGLKFYEYEMGESNVLTDATFKPLWHSSPYMHAATCYYLNEKRRLLSQYGSTYMFGIWFDWLDGSNGVLQNQDFSLIHTISESITAAPRAAAVNEAQNGNYTTTDPTFTSTGATSGSPAGTTVVTFPGNGLLPEATYSLSDVSGNFALVGGFNSLTGGSIVTLNTGIAANTYTPTLVQTYKGVQYPTNIPIVIAAQTTKTIIINTVGAGSFTLPADAITSKNMTVTVIGGGGGGGRPTNGAASGGSSAGGAAWAQSVLNISGLTAGSSTIFYNVGAGGTGATASGTNGTAGGDSWLNISANSAPTLASNGALAKGGGIFGSGGSSGSSVGTTVAAGGGGGNTNATFGQGSPGGGGAGDSTGSGGGGQTPANIANGGGAGGGGTTGAGTAGSAGTGGNGGTGQSGTAGGVGGAGNGPNGSNGSGGAGGGTGTFSGGNGGAGQDYALYPAVGNVGSGGGGGGGGGSTTTTGGAGGQGGLYGGGGGMGGTGTTSGNGGNGGQGCVIYTYFIA